jgi:hypothetical protein
MNFSVEDINGKKKYTVNGTIYGRFEDVPEEFRSFFADANQNQIPDHFENVFDDSASLKNVFNALFKTVAQKTEEKLNVEGNGTAIRKPSGNNGSSGANNTKDRIYSKGNETSFAPTFVKISIGILLGILIAWGYLNYGTSKELPPEDNVPIVVAKPDEQQELLPRKMYCLIEDPNTPPYHMFIGVYEKEKLSFTFDMLEGELGETSDTLIQTTVTEEGTNLVDKTYTFQISSTTCNPNDEEAESSKIILGELEFTKLESGDAGAGQTYIKYLYLTERNKQCIKFSIDLHLTNIDAFDPPVASHNVEADVESFERLIKTIAFKNQ